MPTPAPSRAGRRALAGSLERYLQEIAVYPILSREAEGCLARRAAAGDQDALDALVRANLRFVVAVAKKYQGQGVPLADLVNEGNLGLLRACRRFDPDQRVKFISYAVWWIRQALLQALADQRTLVRLPSGRASQLHRVTRRADALAQRLGRVATAGELADETSLTERDVVRAWSIPRVPVSLDAPLTPGGDDALIEHLADEGADAPDRALLEETRTDTVAALLGSLDAREAHVLRLYFGFDGDPLTLEQIGARLGVTRERVRQLKVRALSRLRTGRSGALARSS